jgi:hypothetical protein
MTVDEALRVATDPMRVPVDPTVRRSQAVLVAEVERLRRIEARARQIRDEDWASRRIADFILGEESP